MTTTESLTPAEWSTLREALATVARIAATAGRSVSVTFNVDADDDGTTMDGIEVRGFAPPASELDDIEADGPEMMAHDKATGAIVVWQS